MKSILLSLPIAVLLGSPARCGPLSREDLKKALDENPDLVVDALKSKGKDLLDILQKASDEERQRQQKEQEAAIEREIDEAIQKPLSPAIESQTRIRGKKDAKFTLVEYSDFQCPYCQRGYRIVEHLRQKLGDDLRFIYKHKPLGNHPLALPAALHMEAAALQSPDKAWKYHDKLFENQERLSEPYLTEAAKELGLDVARLKKDAKRPELAKRVQADIAEAESFGITGTPGFLLNGVPVRGAYPTDFFDNIIRKLQAAEQAKKKN